MVQCALNGEYTRDDHPDLPVTLEQLVADAVACRSVGAASVHMHPRRATDARLAEDGAIELARRGHSYSPSG